MVSASIRQMSDQADRKFALEGSPKWKQQTCIRGTDRLKDIRKDRQTGRQKEEGQTEARAGRKWSRHMTAEMSGTKKGGKT